MVLFMMMPESPLYLMKTGNMGHNSVGESWYGTNGLTQAVGSDGIPVQLLKYDGSDLQEEIVPDSFTVSNIYTLYKGKGNRAECNSYMGILLLSAPGKVFARVLLNLLKFSENTLPDTQFGFRPNRGTCEAIFSIRQLQENCKEQSQPLVLCFVNLEKAFDSVPREARLH
ncbi:unnamed protein product [Arctia plantaginis]|uniref:Reverse transcriptase domain-containing protein n=1 Tax=Arctia plantaginis TaxID=874455 RepID=A0A8S1ANV2_ARCPL|nr:unnamed protein product [Arctia plantaginis]